MTRFRVTTDWWIPQTFDTSDEALKYGMSVVYMSDNEFLRKKALLDAGKAVWFAYGFSEVSIEPISDELQEKAA